MGGATIIEHDISFDRVLEILDREVFRRGFKEGVYPEAVVILREGSSYLYTLYVRAVK